MDEEVLWTFKNKLEEKKYDVNHNKNIKSNWRSRE